MILLQYLANPFSETVHHKSRIANISRLCLSIVRNLQAANPNREDYSNPLSVRLHDTYVAM